MTKTILFISTMLFSLNTFATLNYPLLEQQASTLLCETEPKKCVKFSVQKGRQTLGPFVVDGITLPADAKRDADSQRAMLGANLYVKEDGSVGAITSSDVTLPTIAKKKSATDAVVIILSADPLPINTDGDAKINVPLPVGTD
jgi:hypothetical protein